MSAGRVPGRWRRRLALVAWWIALVAVFLLPYAQLSWWPFPASTVWIVALGLLRWRRAALARLGFPRSAPGLAFTAVTLALLWVLFAYILVPLVAADRGMRLEPWPWNTVAEFAFQALNEEIVLGYLLVVGLARRTRRPVLVAVGVALFFSLLHHALYRYGELGEILLPLTLVSLVAVGVLRNSAILLAGHLGFAWALHAAWNLVMFSGRWIDERSELGLSEPQVLDAVLAYMPMAVALIACALVLLAYLQRRSTSLRIQNG